MKPEECSALVLLSNANSECFLRFRLMVQALQIGSGIHSKLSNQWSSWIVRIHKPDQRSIYHISIVTQRYSLALNGASLAAANREKKPEAFFVHDIETYPRICGEIKKSQQTRHAHSVTPWNCEVQTTVGHHPRMDTNMKIMIEHIRILNQQTRTE